MTQEAGVPADFWGRIQKMIEDGVAKLARSGMLRNASITDGGLTIKGGFLRLLYRTFDLLYVGPVGSPLGDGSLQQTIRLRRADGTIALQIYDSFPGSDGTLNQAMTWYDRSGNAVFADDTDSGQGIARPYVPMGGWARARFGDWTVQTTSATFETLWRGEMFKQHPRLSVATLASMDTAATTGEIRVLIDGTQFGDIKTIGFVLTTSLFGPGAVPGNHMDLMHVEIQGRRTSASGAIKVEPLHMVGRQT